MYVQQYRSIKVPVWVYENWKQAELALKRRGAEDVAPLPAEILAPPRCPACHSRMRSFELRYSYRRCERCGYTQQDLTATSNFLGGAVLGVALTLLFKALSDVPSSQRRSGESRRR